MKKEVISKLGTDLYEAATRREPIPVISHDHDDFTIADAYDVQRSMLKNYVDAGYHFSGRKVGMTSLAMQEQFDIDEPDYGYLFEEFKFQNGSQINIGQFIDPMVEAELGFVLKEDLIGGNIEAKDVLSATDYIVACMEIIDARTQHFDTCIADSIADNASFAAYIVGDEIIKPFERDLSLVGMVVEKNNKQVTTSSGASVMGNPVNAVAWLANKMIDFEEPLKAGEFILSGSFISAIPVQKNDVINVKYGGFGDLKVEFVEG